MEENIKEAFQKVKQDISLLTASLETAFLNLIENNNKTSELHNLLSLMNKSQIQLNDKLAEIEDKIQENTQKIDKLDASTHKPENPALRHINTTDSTLIKPLEAQNQGISIGNQGVSTDRQTDTSTDRQTQNTQGIKEKTDNKTQNSFEEAIEALDSLDNIKKEIRLKIKRLTEQELLVFTKMYELDNELGYSDYKLLSERLNLTESSIRDYVGRLIKKGIPVEKSKIDNKLVQLHISPTLKKIASLNVILQLRNL